MMETLLTAPLYLITLAGLFWLGELCMARLAFTQGESLRLWENGLRHPFTPVAERRLFPFLPDRNRAGEVVTGSGLFSFTRTSPPQTGGWGIGISGGSSMATRRSDWSVGANTGALAALGRNEALVQNLSTSFTKAKHLLERNVYAGRVSIYTDTTNNGTAWKSEYLATWTVGSTRISMPSGGDAETVRLYNSGSRNANYNQWSL